MCLNSSGTVNFAGWNWDGDQVVRESIVPSSRPVVGARRGGYDIDVREFLVSTNNALLRRVLEGQLAEYLGPRQYARFRSRKAGSFDFRAEVIARWVGESIRYQGKSGRDPWQFPDETLAVKRGDCEDRAFLIASLLLASGISGYHVRVALGRVESGAQHFDHAWVMYKSEAGRWTLIEPLRPPTPEPAAGLPAVGVTSARAHRLGSAGIAPPAQLAAYVPLYLFNDEHLWVVARAGRTAPFGEIASRDWKRMSPKFAGVVHRSILRQALNGIAPPELLDFLERRFSHAVLGLFGPTVDASDRGAYNPLDHFDNALIDQSFSLVNQRLKRFRDNPKNFLAFAQAAHGIADFYAHSSYVHFAALQGSGDGRFAQPYDPAQPLTNGNRAPSYQPPGERTMDLTSGRFSINPRLWRGTRAEAAALFAGRLISGRCGQVGDSHGNLVDQVIEGQATLPAQFAIPEAGGVPHHEEIAVDSPQRGASHILYGSTEYAEQYVARFNTAVLHIRKIYQDNAAA
jgi:hypothetical protein